jgi:hypothetical protein
VNDTDLPFSQKLSTVGSTSTSTTGVHLIISCYPLLFLTVIEELKGGGKCMG